MGGCREGARRAGLDFVPPIVSGGAPPRAAVRVYLADPATMDEATCAALVTSEDRSELTGTIRPERRAERFASRALLRIALEDWTGRPAARHVLHKLPSGKPHCVDGPAISVTHCRGLVACALAAAGSIGVDVERPAAVRDTDAIARDYFAVDECAWIAAEPSRFYMLWVLKEAYLKAHGVGLAGGLRALQCRIEPPAIRVAAATLAPAHLELRSVDGAFLGVAAVDARLDDLAMVRWTPRAGLRPEDSSPIARTA
jgi:4'-phosphopantetheinyl transferase